MVSRRRSGIALAVSVLVAGCAGNSFSANDQAGSTQAGSAGESTGGAGHADGGAAGVGGGAPAAGEPGQGGAAQGGSRNVAGGPSLGDAGGAGIVGGAGAAGAASGACDPDAPFGKPGPILGGVNSADDELSPRLSSDELTIYIARHVTNDPLAPANLYAAVRPDLHAPFDLAIGLAINTDMSDGDPMLTSDGKTLFFSSDRPNGLGEFDLYQASRSLTSLPFTTASTVPDLNSLGSEVQPFSSSDGELWFSYRKPGANSAYHLRRAPRAGVGFGGAVIVMELDSPSEDSWPMLSADKLTIYYASQRSDGGALGKADIWRARRKGPSAVFDSPSDAKELSSAATDYPGWISADNCRLYLASNRSGSQGYDILVATRAPAA